MVNRSLRGVAALMLALGTTVCSRAADTAPPVATPSVSVSKTTPSIGSPVEMTYTFVVAGDAPAFAEDYRVFVHFLDKDGELMWTDDHHPPTPVREWKPGATIKYSRTMFVPKFPYVGQTRVEVGLFSPTSGERLPLKGETEGLRSYRVATFDMRLETDNYLVIFKDGWHNSEVTADGSGREWHWSKGQATLAFRNPKGDAHLYIQVDQPVPSVEPRRIELRLGGTVIDTFTLNPGAEDLRRVTIPATQFGEGETVELTLSVDKTFVPALVPALKSGDSRELGIRVFRAFVEPA